MKITLLNGSPRNGNTSKALLCFKDSLDSRHSVVQYNLYENSIKACRNCNCCQKEENGCIHNDDSNKILQTLIESDVIVFGTPVYYLLLGCICPDEAAYRQILFCKLPPDSQKEDNSHSNRSKPFG